MKTFPLIMTMLVFSAFVLGGIVFAGCAAPENLTTTNAVILNAPPVNSSWNFTGGSVVKIVDGQTVCYAVSNGGITCNFK